jgi:hypothetical protein
MASGLIWHIAAFLPFVWWAWRYFESKQRLLEIENAVLQFVSWPSEGPEVPDSLRKRAFRFLESEIQDRWQLPHVKILIPEKALQQEAALKLWSLSKQLSPLKSKANIVCCYKDRVWEVLV